MTNNDISPQTELGVGAWRAVRALRCSVDIDDDVGQSGVADRPVRQRSFLPGVEAGPADIEQPSGDLHVVPAR